MLKWWETVINQLSPLALRYTVHVFGVHHVLIEWVDVFTVCWVYFYLFLFIYIYIYFFFEQVVWFYIIIIQAPTKAEPSESEKEAKILAASQTKKEQKVSIFTCCVHV